MPAGTTPFAPPQSPAVRCAVTAWGVTRAGVDTLKALRHDPGPVPGGPLPASFLKHADDQTVAGLAAVLRAIDRHGLAGTDFNAWGVLAAPRFLARATVAHAVKRFQLEGAWGVSPHVIPHRSLHSVSGTVSQALKIHGPNHGVGGGPSGAAKAMLAAAAMVGDPRLPGLWLVLTGWNWEPGLEDPTKPSTNGHHATAAVCSAAALALRPAAADECGLVLDIGPGSVDGTHAPHRNGHSRNGHASRDFSLEAFLDALEGAKAGAALCWQLPCGGRVGMEFVGTGAENRS